MALVVRKGSVWEQAGFENGDIIKSIDGVSTEHVENTQDLLKIMKSDAKKFTFKVLRAGKIEDVEIIVGGSTPGDGEEGMTGDPEEETPNDTNHGDPRKGTKHSSGGMTWKPMNGYTDEGPEKDENFGTKSEGGHGFESFLPGKGVTDPGFDNNYQAAGTSGSGPIFNVTGKGVTDPSKVDLFRPLDKTFGPLMKESDKFSIFKSVEKFTPVNSHFGRRKR